MRWHHWLTILVVFLIAIVFDRYFPQLGNAIPVIPKH